MKGRRMDLAKIKALIDLMAASAVEELDLTEGDSRLRLVRSRASARPAAAAESPPTEPALPEPPPSPTGSGITAPMPGTLYLSPAPGEPSFVTVGERVEAGRTLALVEAMKTLTPVTAERAGTLARVCVENGAAVQAGDVLFDLVA